jgi:transposase
MVKNNSVNEKQKKDKNFDRTPSENDQLREEIKKLREENKKLKDRIKELEAKLQNTLPFMGQTLGTPSSKLFPKSNRPPKGSRPKGAPKGHRGASLKIPEKVDNKIVHSPETCPICGCDQLGKESVGWNQTVFDFQPAPIRIVKHIYKRRWCPRCKKKVSIKSSETLPQRNYGPNIATTVGFFEKLGIPLRTIQLILKTLYGIVISIPELKELSNLLAGSITPEYQELQKEVKTASPVYTDETGFRIDGINNWCWDFVWNDGVVYVIHPSRGKTVPLEVLGNDYNGLLGRDGWYAYDSVGGKHQLCYVHTNRKLAQVEVKRGVDDRGFLKPTSINFRKKGRPSKGLMEFLIFADQLRTIMRDAVLFTERDPEPTLSERLEIHETFLSRLDKLTDTDWDDIDTVRICKHVRKHRDHFFTFVIHPEIRWENNTAERGIRKVATIRNNSGGRRSRKGADALQALLSVFETWRIRGLDVYNEAKKALLRSVGRLLNSEVVA